MMITAFEFEWIISLKYIFIYLFSYQMLLPISIKHTIIMKITGFGMWDRTESIRYALGCWRNFNVKIKTDILMWVCFLHGVSFSSIKFRDSSYFTQLHKRAGPSLFPVFYLVSWYRGWDIWNIIKVPKIHSLIEKKSFISKKLLLLSLSLIRC